MSSSVASRPVGTTVKVCLVPAVAGNDDFQLKQIGEFQLHRQKGKYSVEQLRLVASYVLKRQYTSFYANLWCR